jgi:Tyrosine phosphatase family
LKFWDWLGVLLGIAPSFRETTTPGGTPNLVRFAPGLWRMGQPPNAQAWKELQGLLDANGAPVTIVKLNDAGEGSDLAALTLGWSLVEDPIPPEDNRPWTVLVKPRAEDIRRIVGTILDEAKKGHVVAWHCSHGRDRTGLVAALLGRRLFGWTKREMAKDMILHGFRWVNIDLTEYFVEDR